MPSFNKVIIAGHLTRDPESRFTQKGTAVSQIGIAVNESYGSGDQKKEEVSFFDVVAFGKTAEVVGNHLTKGRAILVEGRLKQERWDDKESGQKRSAVRIVADRIVFLGGEKNAPAKSADQAHDEAKSADQGDDNIPY